MTNTTAHTPGPWLVYNEAARFPGIDGRNSSVVVYGTDNELEGVKGRTHAEALANARLIAAAPELLEALEYLVEWSADRGPGHWPEWDAARAAIAAAKGVK